ncbi:NAD(P)H-binding protein [Nocardia sp. XZ_19_385]|uniref:NAD(P)H-binding protein n=1 Tax=Nocardia sp. XZ_19_385 TaxID=2769488 RepID=UPI001890A6C9|nr:NAD(P)H-binding protein [Nocardia sp. XZ_19_385]
MIMVTGGSGGLARLVVERLAGVEHVVGSRTPDQVTSDGPVRRIDFDDPATLAEGMRGVDTMLLISAGYADDDVVVARHGAAIDAAEQAGVRHIVYTSLTAAGDHLAFALAHRWTERRLMAGRTDWTILRNGIYAEMSIPEAVGAAATGSLTGPLGDGRLAAVAREDLADVTARVLANPVPHRGKVYELVGEHAIGGIDIAAAAAEASGRDIAYRPGSLDQLRKALVGFGVPDWQVPIVVSTYSNIAAGFLAGTDSDLRVLLGCPPRSTLRVIAAAVSGQT